MKTTDIEMFNELGRRGEYYKLATDPAFWQFLNPTLTITENGNAKSWDPFEIDNEELTYVKNSMKKDGYFQILQILDEKEMVLLSQAVTNLHMRQWPPTFCMVYDEFWQVFQRCSWTLSQVLGKDYKVIPNFWVYYVDNNDNGKGWAPHRDRAGVSHLMPDGLPTSLTIWIALNDALPLNGCMYILPASRDPNYPHNLYMQEAKTLQDIRALPAPIGSVLSWNEMLFHWGSRSSAEALSPRMSVALGFQRGDVTPRETPLINPKSLPTFNQRLSLIGQHFFRFGIHLNLPQQTIDLGKQLSGLGEPIQVWDTVPYPGDEKYKADLKSGHVQPMLGPSATAYNTAPSVPAPTTTNTSSGASGKRTGGKKKYRSAGVLPKSKDRSEQPGNESDNPKEDVTPVAATEQVAGPVGTIGQVHDPGETGPDHETMGEALETDDQSSDTSSAKEEKVTDGLVATQLPWWRKLF